MKCPSITDGLGGMLWLSSILFLAWVPDQVEFHFILPAALLAFATYFYFIFFAAKPSIRTLFLLAVVARIAIIPSFPNLSDDIYRFIWDGRLWHLGMHPYAYLPADIAGTHPGLTLELFEQLNSKQYFSIYPPVPQFLFWIATFIHSPDLWVESTIMKSTHAIVDIGSLFILTALLKEYHLPEKRVLLYALNPLIIIELVGNLHHEGILIFFLLCALYCIKKERVIIGGIFFALSVATKILPILFLPLLFFYLKDRKRWTFIGTVILTTFLLFAPLLPDSQLFLHLGESANLYLRKFEFNAGCYYVLREIGYLIKGYNTIHILGPMLMGVAASLILALAVIPLRRQLQGTKLINLLLWTYLAYALLSITLHPWYIAILIPLCAFTSFRTPVIWSGLIMFTYINYSYAPYHENLWVVAAEYILVFSLFFFEIKRHGFLSPRYSPS